MIFAGSAQLQLRIISYGSTPHERHWSLPPARGPTLVDEAIGRLYRGADGRGAFSCSFGARASRPLMIMSGRDARAPEDHERRRSLPPAARFLPLFLVSGAFPAMSAPNRNVLQRIAGSSRSWANSSAATAKFRFWPALK